MTEQATEVLSIITAVLTIVGIIGLLIFMCYADLKTAQRRKEFKDNLTNEHDKALIMEYENQKFTLKRKKQK